MQSCIYSGRLSHRRFCSGDSTVAHSFKYPIDLLYVDLEELAQGALDVAFAQHPFWSARRFNLAWWRRKDYLHAPEQDLAQIARATVKAELGYCPSGPIRLLTQLRFMGIGFNPVNFYYCFAEDGETLEVLMAEVNNTPWGEKHCYVLPLKSPENKARIAGTEQALTVHRAVADKIFHVSPFMPMNMHYEFRCNPPNERLTFYIVNWQAQTKYFDASLSLQTQAFSRSTLNRVLWRNLWFIARTKLLIHWEAVKLWWKGCRIYGHPKNAPPASSQASPHPVHANN